ncbi:hypothetical protein Ciccas_013036, partial [Cichlidogyrus casuarinus]
NGLYTNPITFTTLPSADTGTLTVSYSSLTANQALIAVTETSPNRSACGVYLFQYVVESSNGQSVATYKSPLNTQLVSNLQPSTAYTVKVSVVESTSGSAGSTATTSFTTTALPKIVIPSPTSIAATSTTGSAITLVWVTPQPPSSITITGYEVFYTGPDGTPKTAKVATTIPLTTITDLKPCTIYSIAVKTVGAENNGKEIQSEFSTPSQVQTAVGKPSQVDSVTVTPLNAKTAKIVIADSAARSCGTPAYTVSIKNEANNFIVASDTSPGKTFVLNGLKSETKYVAEAMVFDSATNVYSAPVTSTSFQTVKVESPSAPPSCTATLYQLTLKQGDTQIAQVKISSTTYTFTNGIQPNTAYIVSAQTLHARSNDLSAAITKEVQTTGPSASRPKPPTKVVSTGSTSNSITLAWTAPTTSVTGYAVSYSSSSSSGFVRITNAQATTTTITGLNPCTQYTIRIQSAATVSNAELLSEHSSPDLVKSTSNPIPSTPDSVTIAQVDYTTLKLTISDRNLVQCGTLVYAIELFVKKAGKIRKVHNELLKPTAASTLTELSLDKAKVSDLMPGFVYFARVAAQDDTANLRGFIVVSPELLAPRQPRSLNQHK